MAIDFPNSPTVGQTFTSGNNVWQWDGTAWQIVNVSYTPHAATHAYGGTDPVTLAQSQITNLTTDLASKGAMGGGTDKVFYENDVAVTTSYTITTNKNAFTAGPVTVNSGAVVTVPSGSVWTIA